MILLSLVDTTKELYTDLQHSKSDLSFLNISITKELIHRSSTIKDHLKSPTPSDQSKFIEGWIICLPF